MASSAYSVLINLKFFKSSGDLSLTLGWAQVVLFLRKSPPIACGIIAKRFGCAENHSEFYCAFSQIKRSILYADTVDSVCQYK